MASATTHMSWAPVLLFVTLFVTLEAMDFLAPRWRVALLGLVHTGLVEPLREEASIQDPKRASMQLHADVDGLLSWELAFVGTWEEDARAFRRDFSIGSSKMQSEARPLSACRRHMGVPSTSGGLAEAAFPRVPPSGRCAKLPLFDSSGESFRPGLRFGHSASVQRALARLGAGLLATAAMMRTPPQLHQAPLCRS